MDTDSKRRGAPDPQDPRPAVFAAGAVPVPNWFFDQLMPRVSQRYFAVLLVVWRNTIGRRRRRNHIALSQIRRGARVSKDTARSALRFWEQAGLLRRTGRCGLRGTHEWEALAEAGSQQVVERLVAAGQPLGRKRRMGLPRRVARPGLQRASRRPLYR